MINYYIYTVEIIMLVYSYKNINAYKIYNIFYHDYKKRGNIIISYTSGIN